MEEKYCPCCRRWMDAAKVKKYRRGRVVFVRCVKCMSSVAPPQVIEVAKEISVGTLLKLGE